MRSMGLEWRKKLIMEATEAREIRDKAVKKKLEPIYEMIGTAALCGESALIIRNEDLTNRMVEELKEKAYAITSINDTEMQIIW